MLFRDGHVRKAHLNRVRTPGLLDDIGGALGIGDPAPGGNGGGADADPTDPGQSSSPPASTPSSTKTTATSTSHSTASTPANTPPPSTSTSESKSTPLNTGTSNSQPSNTVTNNPTPQASISTPTVPANTDTDLNSGSSVNNNNGNLLPTTSSSPSSTSAADPEDHTTIKYIGYAAGAVLGFAVLVALIMFIMRRINKRKEQESLGDVFDRNSFVRDSVALPDHVEHDDGDRTRPRPPTMIDRRIRAANNGSPDYSGFTGAPAPPLPGHGSEEGYYGGNAYGNAYGQQGGYDQYNQYNGGYGNGYDNQYDQYGHYGAPQAGYGYQDSPAQSPMADHFSEHPGQNAQYLNHQVGGPEYPALPAAAAVAGTPTQENSRSLTRQPSSRAPAVDYPNVAELGRGTSVTPYQAAQYAEIGKRLDDPNAVHATNSSQAYARLDRHGQPAAAAQRPNSEYKDDDAYGGI